jgi:nucleoside phosphorylase
MIRTGERYPDEPPPSPPTCLIAALESEAEAVIAEREFGWVRVADKVWDSGRFPLRLALSGVGKVLASWCFARYAESARRIVCFGTSASPGFEEIGSLYLAREFVEHDFDLSGLGLELGVTPDEGMEGPLLIPPSASLAMELRTAAAACKLELGECRSASGDIFVFDAMAARNLAARTGARLLDMESAALAKLAVLRAGRTNAKGERISPEFLALRYVSDNADHRAGRSWKEELREASMDFADLLLAFAHVIRAGG